jgi:hypothetical protein
MSVMNLKTVYDVKVFGRPLGAIGIFHEFKIVFILDGVNHTDDEIRLGCYEKADHIQWHKVNKKEVLNGYKNKRRKVKWRM